MEISITISKHSHNLELGIVGSIMASIRYIHIETKTVIGERDFDGFDVRRLLSSLWHRCKRRQHL